MEVADLAYIDETGYHFSDYPTYLEWLQGKYREIYGADVYLESDSQDGQFLAVLAKSFYDTAALGASVYNSFSPATAQGVGLSRNVQINGITRRSATYSTCDVTIGGTSGTVITGGIVVDELDQKWTIPDTTIPIAGTIVVTATAQDIGAVNAQAGSINGIFTPTLGWQTVTNIAAATPGEPVETDAELRARQKISTSNPSLTVMDGTVGAVANVSGVTQVRGYENDTESTDGNGLVAHSIEIFALGGDAQTIANTIALHKTPGTKTVGTTSETVYDSHGMPLTIRFTRPTVATISVEITVAAKAGWSTDYEALIAAQVAETINAFGIGNNILITRLYQPAYLNGAIQSQTYDLVLVRLKKNAGAFGTANISLNFDEYPVCDPDTNFTFIVT
jgi:uncharacterized phage protein gp47/JayE